MSKQPNRKVTLQMREEMKQLRREGVPTEEIARRFNLSTSCVRTYVGGNRLRSHY